MSRYLIMQSVIQFIFCFLSFSHRNAAFCVMTDHFVRTGGNCNVLGFVENLFVKEKKNSAALFERTQLLFLKSLFT